MDSERNAQYIVRLENALHRFARLLTAAAVAQQADEPGPLLSSSQRIVLRALAADGQCQVSEVASHLQVTLSAATGLVDRLVKARLVTRERDQKDRRVVWVKVTAEGVAALEASERRRRIALSQLVSHMSEPDMARLCDLLEQIGTA